MVHVHHKRNISFSWTVCHKLFKLKWKEINNTIQCPMFIHRSKILICARRTLLSAVLPCFHDSFWAIQRRHYRKITSTQHNKKIPEDRDKSWNVCRRKRVWFGYWRVWSAYPVIEYAAIVWDAYNQETLTRWKSSRGEQPASSISKRHPVLEELKWDT